MSTEEKAIIPEDYEILRTCLLLVEQKFGMGTHHTWTESSYKVLSNLITTASKRTVSTNTLRRLYDKVVEGDGAYSPKVETKNALSIYLGYEDWYHFVTRKGATAPTGAAVTTASQSSEPRPELSSTQVAASTAYNEQASAAMAATHKAKTTSRIARNNRLLLIGIIAFMVAGAVWVWLNNMKVASPIRRAKLRELSNPSSKASLPFAHDFTVEYEGYNPDSLNVESHEGNMGTVSSSNNYFSTRYLVPGPYVVKLRNGSHQIDYLLTTIKSKGWQRLITTGETAFEYPEDKTMQDAMGLSLGELRPLAMRAKHRLKTMYLNFGELDFPIDSFRLEARTKITSLVNDMDCYSTKMKVLGDSGQFNLSTTRVGCGNLVFCSASDTFVNGNIQPMPQLALPDTWHDMVMEVRGKVMTCWIDDKEVLVLPFRKSGGKTLGISLTFEGDGHTEYVSVKSLSGKVLHEKWFKPRANPGAKAGS